jgi:hypothetical protein
MPLIGDVTARIGVDDSRLRRGIDDAGKWTASKFKAIGVAAAASFATAFAVGQVQKAIDTTAQIKELSEQTGLSTEEFQRLAYQVRQAGGSMQDVVMAANTLDRQMAKGREGNKQSIKDFETLGLTMEDLANPSRLDVINKIQAAFMSIKGSDRGNFLDALRRLFGDDSAKRFIAAFQEGWVDGLGKAYVITDDTLDKIKEITGAFQDADDKLKKGMADTVAGMKDDIIEFNRIKSEAQQDVASSVAHVYNGLAIVSRAAGVVYEAMFGKSTFDQMEQGVNYKENKQRLDSIRSEMEKLFPSSKPTEAQAEAIKEAVEPLKNVLGMLGERQDQRRIGGFMVGSESQILQSSRDQLRVLKQISQNTRNIATGENITG